MATNATSQTIHAPMYQRVVMRLLMGGASWVHQTMGSYLMNEATRGATCNKERWQGRKDSNPRPSVLETDALTRLSYAPKRLRNFTQPPPSPPLGSTERWPRTICLS